MKETFAVLFYIFRESSPEISKTQYTAKVFFQRNIQNVVTTFISAPKNIKTSKTFILAILVNSSTNKSMITSFLVACFL